MNQSKNKRIPWNKGLTKETDKRVPQPWLGKKRSKETIEKMSTFKKGNHYSTRMEFKKGQIPWNKGKKMIHSGSFKSLEKHWNWNGGITKTVKGYIKVLCKEHPRCDRDGYVFEHILIMENYLGRYLNKSEVVHHINFKKDDNNIKNLLLFKNSGEHTKFHMKLNKKKLVE